MTEITRTYYKIHFPKNAGKYDEWYRSRNGTEQWNAFSQVKAILTGGMRGGYKGQIRTEFEDYEIVEFSEHVRIETRVVPLEPKE